MHKTSGRQGATKNEKTSGGKQKRKRKPKPRGKKKDSLHAACRTSTGQLSAQHPVLVPTTARAFSLLYSLAVATAQVGRATVERSGVPTHEHEAEHGGEEAPEHETAGPSEDNTDQPALGHSARLSPRGHGAPALFSS